MSEIDYTNIANASIATPGSGVTAAFVDTDKKLKTKNDAGTVVELADWSFQSIATAGATTTFTNTSPFSTIFTGVTTQILVMPDATTLTLGKRYHIGNASTGLVTINANGGGALWIMGAGSDVYANLTANGTSAGTWDIDYVGLNAASGDVLTVPASGGTAVVLTGTQSIAGVKTMTNMTALTNTNAVPAITVPAGGVVLTNAVAGAIETDGHAMYYTHNTTDGRAVNDLSRIFRLTGTVGPISTIADVFGGTSAIGMAANGVYEIEWHVYAIQNTGAATTWTFTITLSGTVTRGTAHYLSNAIGGIGTAAAPQMAGVISFTATQALPVTGSMAGPANHYTLVRAIVDVGATPRNVRLSLTVAANNATIQPGSYYRARRISAGNTGAFTA